jgi:hypothetical protein
MRRGRSKISVDRQRLGGSEAVHAVRFYKDSGSLCDLVASFLGVGFRQGQPAVVIATPEHLDGILQRLDAQAFNVRQLQDAGELVVLDAQSTLKRFMVDGAPNAAKFADTLIPVFEKLSRGRRSVLRAYGEMVDVLWKQQQTVAATRLEMLWNELARRHSFSLLCGYAMGNFYKDGAVADICSHHSHVFSADGAAAEAG